jgi:lysine 2,3-aminomutase
MVDAPAAKLFFPADEWRETMSTATRTLRRPQDLVDAGLVPDHGRAALDEVAKRYAIAITPAIADLVAEDAPSGPIAAQFVPDAAELKSHPDEADDPIGDDAHSPVPGIVHRYPDRVLLKPVHVCAVYCRYCFRRTMVGPGKRQTLSPQALATAFDYIRARPEIWEVILTGGDPLVLSPRKLAAIVRTLVAIEHVQVVRIHTRLPVADPAKITPALVRAMKATPKATYVVLHANHARELSPAARAACARIVDAGIPMLSQSVLLRGVNDNPQALAELMKSFVACRIKPYYLHHADLAPGTGHFRTSIAEGQALMRALHGRHSGLCQPQYVLDIPGGHGKSPVGPRYLTGSDSEGYEVTDFQGDRHSYACPAADTALPR